MSPPPTPPTLPADIEAALKRLKLSAMRRQGADILQTAKTQRWAPDEILRVLVEPRDGATLEGRDLWVLGTTSAPRS